MPLQMNHILVLEPDRTFALRLASWEGSIGLAKCELSTDVLSACRLGIERYLETLRPNNPSTR